MTEKLLKIRIEMLKDDFSSCKNKDLIYQKIISFGNELKPLPQDEHLDTYFVPGCQSRVFLKSFMVKNKVFFKAYSDALISKGLVSILVRIYSGLGPEIILKNKPLFLEELGLLQSLSLNRSNGVLAVFQKMQKDALKFILEASKARPLD